ncbi:CPBP family intramembrane glutamic endopeptidase [Caldisphaera sp.]|uniref:CPBP family intramembrane glutamic endopeptidase n=1 Tax=Caldisphaera sp. TaxID=2060322 RepID=UPI003D0EB295
MISSVLFSIYHFSWGIGGMFGTFILGFVLAYVFIVGESLLPNIVSHAIIDGLIEPGLIISVFALGLGSHI